MGATARDTEPVVLNAGFALSEAVAPGTLRPVGQPPKMRLSRRLSARSQPAS